MRLYFVRHGDSEDSSHGLHQCPDSPLSKNGRNQAELIAQRFKTIPIDLIISSPLERAKQTTEIINNIIKKEIEYNNLLAEEKRPTEIEGKVKNNDFVVSVKRKIMDNYTNPDYRYSDEENFYDLKRRGLKLITYLEKLQSKNVLLVSHGTIIRMFFWLLVFGRQLTPGQFLKFSDLLTMSKVGLTVFDYSKENGWKLITWNDQSHLG